MNLTETGFLDRLFYGGALLFLIWGIIFVDVKLDKIIALLEKK